MLQVGKMNIIAEELARYKIEIYNDLQHASDPVSKHDAVIVLGDMNGKLGKEIIYQEVFTKHSKHDETGDNSIRIAHFAAANQQS